MHLAYSYPFVPFPNLVTCQTLMELVLQFLLEPFDLPIHPFQATVLPFFVFASHHLVLVHSQVLLVPPCLEIAFQKGFLHFSVFSFLFLIIFFIFFFFLCLFVFLVFFFFIFFFCY